MKLLSNALLMLMASASLNKGFCQTKEDTKELKIELLKLMDYSARFDSYKLSSEKDSKYIAKRDSVEKLYRAQIQKIKHGPRSSDYLSFLDVAIGRDSAFYSKNLGYNYFHVDVTLNIMRSALPTQLEYYKVVRYSLFEKDKDELLPLKDIPFLRHKSNIALPIMKLEQ
ncbi:hypothetical protein [Parapedobacter tibetensis]|uniref:hypothetical protein n=1 Tax=Parapedobacter tibetensis TaxID=2972951 RepID=UPI00214D7582|nr:hypothetical protein [Parapedobacter tibetensis]